MKRLTASSSIVHHAKFNEAAKNGALHECLVYLQQPTTVNSIYQGYPAKRYLYPIYFEINCGVLYGTLIFWEKYEYPYVVIANSLGGEPFKAKSYYLHDIFPEIEKYIKAQ
ncbi:MAG: hypothetical protein RIS64_3679 [Bacteroidota bacterium]|jgi:hypothetical protein